LLALGILSSAGGALLALRDLDDAFGLVTRTTSIIGEADGVLATLVDAETGQRGFLLTGEERYLPPYDAAVARLPGALDRLAGLLAESPGQVARVPAIRAGAEAKLAELADTVALRRAGDAEGALRLVRTDAGKARMDALRMEVSAIGNVQRRLLAERIEARDQRAALATGLVGLAGLLAVVLAIVAGLGAVAAQRAARQRAERALSAGEARYQALTEASAQLVWVMRRDGSLAFASRSFREYTGLGMAEIAVADWSAVLHPEDRDKTMADIAHALQRGEGFEIAIRIRRHDGAWRWILGRAEPVRDESGHLYEWMGTTLDVHDRREAEVAARNAEARSRTLFEAAPVASFVMDDETLRILDCNAAAAALLGYDREELRALRLTDIDAGQGADDMRDRAGRIETGEVHRFETCHRTRKGELRDVLVSTVPLQLDGQRLFYSVVVDVTDQRAAEAALLEREARFRDLVFSIDEGYCLCEIIQDEAGQAVDYRFIEVNPLFEEMTGLSDAVGRRVRDLVPGLEMHWVETYARVALGGERLRFEQESPAMGRWFNVFATPVEARGHFALVFSDVTERRRAERALLDTEAMLRATIAFAPFPVLLHAEDGEIVQASQAWQDISGWRWPEDIPTIADWTERAYGERNDTVRDYIDTLYTLDRRVDEGDYRIRTRHDGEHVWAFGSAPVGSDPQGRRLVVSMAADVTELRRVEAELRDTLAQQRAIYANAPAGLSAHDRNMRFLAVNERLAAINGVPAADHIGRTPREVIPETADFVEPLIRRVLETGEPVTEMEIEAETAAHPGERRFYLASYYPVRASEDGAVEGVSIAVLDIHARKRAEATLRDLAATLERRVEERTQALSETVAELEAFAYSVSHDLRAPLRSMEGFAQALLEDHAKNLGPQGRRYAERIAAAAQRMDGLIGDLLEYSRLSRTDVTLRPVDLLPAIDGAMADVRDAIEHLGATVEIVTPMPGVLASPPVLRQVVANLVGNALKFIPPGEAPRVKVWAEQRGPKNTAGPRCVRLWVEDNGIGVAPEHQERIFRVFERLHADSVYPGTGIGLAIVRRGAERMDGSAGVEGHADGSRGSRFWVELPAAP
jgi:PAS domain S-box-containing protein